MTDTARHDEQLLERLAQPTDDTLARLHRQLAARAEAGGLLDVAYRNLDTPVGQLLLAATGQGLVRLAYPTQDEDRVLTDLADQVSPRMLHAPARLDPVARQLEEYFNRDRRQFDLDL